MHANVNWASEQRPIAFGALVFMLLLVVYFGTLTLVSGWPFAVTQSSEFWYFILLLAAGFGIPLRSIL
jgi:P-type Cu+ transporter